MRDDEKDQELLQDPPDIIEKLLPTCQVHFLAGAPGAGKTTLAAQLLQQIRDGGRLFGRETNTPPFIGVLAADRTWGSHQQWFDAVGYGDIPRYSLVDSPEASVAALDDKRILKHIDLLEGLLNNLAGGEAPAGALFLVDPFSLFVGGDINNYMKVYRHMLEVNRLCLRKQWTMLGLMHGSKQKKIDFYARPQDRMAGTTALVGCAGTVMYLCTPDESDKHKRFQILAVMAHHAPTFEMKVYRNGDGLFSLDAEPKIAGAAETESLTTECLAFAELFGADQPTSVTEAIAAAITQLGVGRSSAYRYKDQLKEAGIIVEAPGRKGWYIRPRKPGEDA